MVLDSEAEGNLPRDSLGRHLGDMELLRAEEGIGNMLGFQPPGARVVGDFLEQFHEAQRIEQGRLFFLTSGVVFSGVNSYIMQKGTAVAMPWAQFWRSARP